MQTLRKLAVLLLLFVLLAPLAASAAGSKAGTHKAAKAERAPVSLGSLVRALISGIWMKEGSVIDPHGSPAPDPLNSLDAGCVIDPSGRCHS